MRAPDWTLYRSLLAVVEAGGLTAAARRLGLSQPTLSRQIAQLETALGVALFERRGRGLAPSAIAIRIAAEARRMEEAELEIASVVARETRAKGGVVRLTASEIVACYALPQILSKFVANHPDMQIEVDATNEVTNLLSREADIAIRMTRPLQTGLIARRLPDVPTGFYAAQQYLTAHPAPERVQDLAAHRLVGYDKSQLMLQGAKRAKLPVTRESFAFRCDHQIVCWRMVLAGYGVGVVARFVGDAEPGVVRLLPNFPSAPMQMWLVARADMRTTPRIRLVFDALTAGLKKLEL